jgi:hypothetical protein
MALLEMENEPSPRRALIETAYPSNIRVLGNSRGKPVV